MRIDILTLFPEMFKGYFDASILSRAQESGLLQIMLHNIRDFAVDKHRVTDEPPFGGGGGMVLKPEPLFRAVESLVGRSGADADQAKLTAEESLPVAWPIILLTPQGRLFTHKVARELCQQPRLTLICGRYEGVDERVRRHLVTDEISIGDYVLTGGELAAMVVVDATARLLPGVLGAESAAAADSHATGLLEGPHYTRPAVFRDWTVPEVLRSGHEARLQRWRREQALRRTWRRRPEFLLSAELSEEDKRYLMKLADERASELAGR
ncbi:MAG: tRNA (guanosine(37)-N1)-methyltransferase TrmD [Chloroflexota bacterium]|nr:MAG: tRNA (guanosine(37)-N1)-methyltransferase TrmD [Chloroflexota bacterium]